MRRARELQALRVQLAEIRGITDKTIEAFADAAELQRDGDPRNYHVNVSLVYRIHQIASRKDQTGRRAVALRRRRSSQVGGTMNVTPLLLLLFCVLSYAIYRAVRGDS